MADPNPDTIGGFFSTLTYSMIMIIMSLVGFWTTFVKNMVTRKEVEQMIGTHSQYSKDREFIMARLSDHKEDSATLFKALNKNTEVMGELKIQIGILSKTLEALERRIEKD